MNRRASRARSASAHKGWQTRRANARARSASARKGWQTRRANAQRKVGEPIARRGKFLVFHEFSDWLVAFSYRTATGASIRLIDFLAFHYRTESNAIEATWDYIEKHKRLKWILGMDWSVRAVWRADSKPGSRAHVSER